MTMKTVQEVSRLAGVSVRTLHHYDAIGLLKPTKVTGAGYRFYDDGALSRLHSILLFRELQFPLKEIGEMLDNPKFDPDEALERQIELLELQRKRLGELIDHARELKEKGSAHMGFKAFDKSELEQYKAEAREKWGKTDTWKEYERKEAAGSDFNGTAGEMMSVFARFGAVKEQAAEGSEVQALVAELRQFITEHYYTCTPQILSGLGQMYTADERFRANIDKAGGPGTAEFAAAAIAAYCEEN
jgi:DNA-binding transcriptional MerR regulator